METCKHCGWEVNQSCGVWLDTWEHSVCYWVGDEPRQHEPSKKFSYA